MRIGLDATPLIAPAGGIPRYVTELALALSELDGVEEIRLLSDQTELFLDPRLRVGGKVSWTPPDGVFRRKWWSLGLPLELRRRRVDLFHGTNYEIPYLPLTPAVMTVHDLSPWKPPPIRPLGSERVRSRALKLLRLARRILTPSEAIRRAAIETFQIPAARIEAIPLAPSPALEPSAEEAAGIRRQLRLEGRYLCYAGARGARKNIPLLIEAWRLAKLHIPDLQLLLAGPPGQERPPTQPGLRDLGVLEDDRLAAVLAGAAAFVYASSYEGFGLPVLEAMRAGTPVIISRDPAVVEVAGGAALVVSDEDCKAWAEAIVAAVSNTALAARLRRAGRERAAQFTWRLTAERTYAAYERAIGRA